MRKFVSLVGSLLLVVMFIQGKVFAQDDAVVAKIGDNKITLFDFNRIIGYYDAEKQKIFDSNPKLKEQLLQQYVQGMVIADLAKKQGFDKQPEIKAQMDLFLNSLLANEYLKREVTGNVSISEDDMKHYYNSHKFEFKIPEMARASQILIQVDKNASEKDKKAAKEKAEDILKKIRAGEDFAKLASEYSDDQETKSKDGDMGFFPKNTTPKPIENAAFTMKPGEVSDIIEAPLGYYIIKAEGKKEQGMESFEDVKEKIKQRMLKDQTQAKLSEFINKAMKDANVEIHPELLTGGKK